MLEELFFIRKWSPWECLMRPFRSEVYKDEIWKLAGMMHDQQEREE